MNNYDSSRHKIRSRPTIPLPLWTSVGYYLFGYTITKSRDYFNESIKSGNAIDGVVLKTGTEQPTEQSFQVSRYFLFFRCRRVIHSSLR